MNSCLGIMGKLFGHKYHSFTTWNGGIPAQTIKTKNNHTILTQGEILDVIICKRCGRKIETKEASDEQSN